MLKLFQVIKFTTWIFDELINLYLLLSFRNENFDFLKSI